MYADAKWSTDFVLGNAALDNEYGPTHMHFKKTYFKKLTYLGKGEANCEPRLSERYEGVVRADGIPAT
jgi:hypothetical protein